MKFIVLLGFLAGLPAAAGAISPLPFDQIDLQMNEAVRTGLIPGGVVLVGQKGKIVYRKAYGFRVLGPQRERMTEDTIFDAASLTKVIATTPAIMRLVEQGKLRLNDPVTTYLPEFQGGKSDITVRLLLTHFSGLPPDIELKPRWSGYDVGIGRALTTKPTFPPGTHFVYSDINFELLGEIVRRLSGKTLAQFAQEEVFVPLGMKETQFLPPPSWRDRIAPTEIDEDTGQPFRGVVHDPTARYMGGIAGHAGVFTTADDLAKYAAMLVRTGIGGDWTPIFNPATIKLFTEPNSPADQPILRGLGWDIDSPYSSNRGDLFPIGSFGHTGFTGTSMWMDAGSQSFVIILTNAVYPKRGKSLVSLRSRIATIAASSMNIAVANSVELAGYRDTIEGAGVYRTITRDAVTLTGLDVLEQQKFQPLQGQRIGLITNQTGADRAGNRNVDLMLAAGVRVVSLFSPEHGINGTADSDVANSRDAKSGLPVVSLFQPEARRLRAEQMKDLDSVVFDIQDVGARFYTYSCTMLYALEEAGKAHKPFYVLDRPNPITGTHTEGPLLDNDLHSFVGCYDMPVRHGMTFGELATMANAEQHWNADLRVIKMSNWERGDWFESATLPWINPSPNLRSLNAALLYDGLAMLEAATNYSVGRGTDAPFEQIGADWIDGVLLAQYLNKQFIPGVRVYPVRFTPNASNFAGKQIDGVRFTVVDREAFDSTRLGLTIAASLQRLFPGHLDFERCRFLIGSRALIADMKAGRDASVLWTKAGEEAAQFDERRKPFLLY